MLVGLVILLAILSVGTGYAAILGHAHAGFNMWDLAFVACAVTFLAFFIRLIVSAAAATLESSRKNSARDRDNRP
jgi:membrane protein implicated in regulation of membrane protease activity